MVTYLAKAAFPLVSVQDMKFQAVEKAFGAGCVTAAQLFQRIPAAKPVEGNWIREFIPGHFILVPENYDNVWDTRINFDTLPNFNWMDLFWFASEKRLQCLEEERSMARLSMIGGQKISEMGKHCLRYTTT